MPEDDEFGDEYEDDESFDRFTDKEGGSFDFSEGERAPLKPLTAAEKAELASLAKRIQKLKDEVGKMKVAKGVIADKLKLDEVEIISDDPDAEEVYAIGPYDNAMVGTAKLDEIIEKISEGEKLTDEISKIKVKEELESKKFKTKDEKYTARLVEAEDAKFYVNVKSEKIPKVMVFGPYSSITATRKAIEKIIRMAEAGVTTDTPFPMEKPFAYVTAYVAGKIEDKKVIARILRDEDKKYYGEIAGGEMGRPPTPPPGIIYGYGSFENVDEARAKLEDAKEVFDKLYSDSLAPPPEVLTGELEEEAAEELEEETEKELEKIKSPRLEEDVAEIEKEMGVEPGFIAKGIAERERALESARKTEVEIAGEGAELGRALRKADEDKADVIVKLSEPAISASIAVMPPSSKTELESILQRLLKRGLIKSSDFEEILAYDWPIIDAAISEIGGA